MALTRKKFLVAKIESTYGTDPVLSGGSDAIQVTNVEVTPIESDNVQSAALQGFIGNSTRGTIVANKRVSVTFDVELAGSGTPGTAPAFGLLLKAAGYLRLLLQAQALLTLVSAAALTVPLCTAFTMALAIKSQAPVELLALT
jgi:hypothetical protein